jgi:hypothetical protein
MNRADLLEAEADAWAQLEALRIAYHAALAAWRETTAALELDARAHLEHVPAGYVFPNTRAAKG